MLNPDDWIEQVEPWTDEEVAWAERLLDVLWDKMDLTYDEYIADEKVVERKRQMFTITYKQWTNRVLTQIEKLTQPTNHSQEPT
jgi:hypothetical protein